MITWPKCGSDVKFIIYLWDVKIFPLISRRVLNNLSSLDKYYHYTPQGFVTNQRQASRSRDMFWPIRDKHLSHVTSINLSEARAGERKLKHGKDIFCLLMTQGFCKMKVLGIKCRKKFAERIDIESMVLISPSKTSNIWYIWRLWKMTSDFFSSSLRTHIWQRFGFILSFFGSWFNMGLSESCQDRQI